MYCIIVIVIVKAAILNCCHGKVTWSTQKLVITVYLYIYIFQHFHHLQNVTPCYLYRSQDWGSCYFLADGYGAQASCGCHVDQCGGKWKGLDGILAITVNWYKMKPFAWLLYATISIGLSYIFMSCHWCEQYSPLLFHFSHIFVFSAYAMHLHAVPFCMWCLCDCSTSVSSTGITI